MLIRGGSKKIHAEGEGEGKLAANFGQTIAECRQFSNVIVYVYEYSDVFTMCTFHTYPEQILLLLLLLLGN